MIKRLFKLCISASDVCAPWAMGLVTGYILGAILDDLITLLF